jgi:hypothetical protein
MILELLVGLLAVTALILGVAVLLRLQEEEKETPRREIIVREEVPVWGGGWPLGPYYSHVPVRPILYG